MQDYVLLLKSFAFLFFIALHAFMKAFVPIVFSYDNHAAYAYVYGSMVEVSTMLCHVKVWLC